MDGGKDAEVGSLRSRTEVFSNERVSLPFSLSLTHNPLLQWLWDFISLGDGLFIFESYPERISRPEVTYHLELRLVAFSCSVLHISFSCTWTECQFTNTKNPIKEAEAQSLYILSDPTGNLWQASASIPWTKILSVGLRICWAHNCISREETGGMKILGTRSREKLQRDVRALGR